MRVQATDEKTRKFLKGLARWLASDEGRKEARRYRPVAYNDLELAKVLMRRYHRKCSSF